MSKTALADALKACDNNRSKLARRLTTAERPVERQHIQHWIKKGKVPRWHYESVLAVAKEARK